jgi:hypothetical protein
LRAQTIAFLASSSFLVLGWFFSLWVLELMVSFMTSSSSSKTESLCIFYDVFDVGVFAGSSLIEVSHLYTIGIFILSLLDSSCRPESNKLEFAQFGAHLQKLWQFWFSCFLLFSVEVQWYASGSTACAHGSTAYAVVPLGTTVVLPLEVSPSVQLSVAGLHFTAVAR